MKFESDDFQVKCIRELKTEAGKPNKLKIVATFHNNIDQVAPHVAAALFPEEISQLKLWLNERTKLHKKLQQDSLGNTVLEVFPSILDEAIFAFERVEEIDPELLKDIERKLEKCKKSIDKLDQGSKKNSLKIKVMQDSEVLKEQLDSIRNSI